MTEDDWVSCHAPESMLAFLSAEGKERKLGLFACAAVRLFGVSVSDDLEASVEVGDLRSCLGGLAEITSPMVGTGYTKPRPDAPPFVTVGSFVTPDSVTCLIEAMKVFSEIAAEQYGIVVQVLMQTFSPVEYGQPLFRLIPTPSNQLVYPSAATAADLLRDIFGNPFRPVAVDPRWLTSAAVGVAEGIYADRTFDRLPILADALQDAGCEDADILAHCRGPGPHVRGCWVVDLVLGKQ